MTGSAKLGASTALLVVAVAGVMVVVGIMGSSQNAGTDVIPSIDAGRLGEPNAVAISQAQGMPTRESEGGVRGQPDRKIAGVGLPAGDPAGSPSGGAAPTSPAVPRSQDVAVISAGADPAGGDGQMATAAEILSERVDMSDPGMRAKVVARLRALDAVREREVLAKARRLGIPVSGTRRDGGEFVLRDFEGSNPLYEQTENVNAAISSAAHLVRGTAPFNVDGSGVLIGLWETSLPRGSHQEFGTPSRLTFGEGSSGSGDHATHVAGTLIAAGIDSSLLGMAPAAQIAAYSSAGDSTEMTAKGASYAGEPEAIYLSNHSYGFGRGWGDGNVWSGSFSDDGNPLNDVEDDFGRYSSYAVGMDGLTYNLPYYLPFFSAGNHRNDGPPAVGATWSVGGSSYTYDPARHPAGDGQYKSGYDTCEGKKVAKNIMTVGAVNDAVSGGSRNVGSASLTSFSSTGPTDDGRIKPDIVANGASLRSAAGSGDTATSTKSGTSMASPNAAGSAALLVDYYGTRFPGGAMRSATLKGLILHTADDLGNPGPDYRYGWGLMNTEVAASLIREHAENGSGRMIEDQLTGALGSKSWHLSSAGTGPLRVTLCWTDPPGVNKSGHENRGRALVNDLNLRITGPGGTHLPWTMPHVGDWSVATLDDHATTGVNTVDNVEQVALAGPVAGAYTITVDHAGILTYGVQDFSLIVSGLLPDPLLVSPMESFVATGVMGGTFAPAVKTYTLTNSGSANLDWTAATDASWLDVSPASGSLGPGASVLVTAEVNASANEVPPGSLDASVTFGNTGTGQLFQSSSQLRVLETTGLPFAENFEDSLGHYWEVSGTGTYRTARSAANGPHEGSQHLQMDSATDNVDGRNELTLAIDLSGAEGVQISFWAREFADELNAPPASPFAGGGDFDGVAVSPDGINWYAVFTFPSSFATYAEYTVNLDAEIAAHGLSYNNQFRIRFNQFDDYGIATDGSLSDGIAIDDIRIASVPPPTFATLPLAEDFEGPLADHWRITGTGPYRTRLSGANSPHGGGQHLEMDSSAKTNYARNELTLALDLAGAEGVELSFWAKEFSEESHPPPASPFVGGADFDGVSVSPDGTNWYVVFTFPESFTEYTPFTIDLDAELAAHGLAYNNGFRIRFSQYDNFELPVDGIVIDDVLVVEVEKPEIVVEQPSGLELLDGLGGVDFDSLPLGATTSPVTLTIRNSGTGDLTGLAVLVDGADATDFSAGSLGATNLAPGASTSFTMTFAPGGTGPQAATLHIVSNDADENPFDTPLTGIGLHTLETWRLIHFGTTENSGAGADLTDPNADGIINLMAFATGMDPLAPGGFPLDLELVGDDLVACYQRSRAAMAEGLGFTIEWSDTLTGGWNPAGVAELVTSDDGVLQSVEATLPQGAAGRRFVRLRVSE